MIYCDAFLLVAFTNRTKKEFFRLVKKIPFVQKKIAEEKKKILKDMENSMNADVDGYVTQLPTEGLKMVTWNTAIIKQTLSQI